MPREAEEPGSHETATRPRRLRFCRSPSGRRVAARAGGIRAHSSTLENYSHGDSGLAGKNDGERTSRSGLESADDIQAFDVGKRLAFTHWSPLSGMEDKPENYHIVTFDLRPTGSGTEVVLTQTNQNDAEPLTPENRKEYTKNWTMVLDGLKKTVEGSPPRSSAETSAQQQRT